MSVYNKGHDTLPKKDPEKAVRCRSDPNCGEASEHVKTLTTLPQHDDGHAEPPTKDPDKIRDMQNRSGDEPAQVQEPKLTLEAQHTQVAKFLLEELHIPVLAWEHSGRATHPESTM
ncbi:uncharacterized protein EI90DRAFT_3016410 [Cantharellus anzutake]|uniref:uncharacterized protein n=1 Tax=Cantharellus anzutake TaxID=1750568 RepID=UPI001902F381|nr:uncharacterized protein EI90DRAFT_3016410 [Cantharellus anzutake]KAF8331416.1 hypothetical protein EI90DRAFT_3016410 [Cantharellus anzutake]